MRRLGGRNGGRGAGTRLPGYGRLRVEWLYEPCEVRDRGWEGIRVYLFAKVIRCSYIGGLRIALAAFIAIVGLVAA